MSIYHETLWKKLEEKAMAADEGQPEQVKCGHDYLSAIKGICNDAIALSKTIRDIFPLYTLHDEIHICNVMRLMEKLLGKDIEKLSRDEAAMLVLAACCHDIGMSCSETQMQDLLEDRDRLERYLEERPDAYVKAHGVEDLSKLPEDLLRDFLRAVHPERANDILISMEWPDVLQGKVNRQDLILVCQSHGESAEKIIELDSEYGVDLCMCAVLLRLADILDFDTSRAPRAVYSYSGFDNREDPVSKFSREEWEKHRASHGFFFEQVTNRFFPYDLPYHATCPSMQIEQAVNSYIDWVDYELTACQGVLRYCSENWRNLVLPRKIARKIKPEGYLSGQFCLTLDQDRVLELLVGKNLYQDPGVFVRELLQNAIDAVRTRQQLDRNLPRGWKPQINIRCWMDEEGYHWFRIEDNGIGMNEDIIKKYFLKVGCSYYASNDFQQEKYRYQANEDYMPISRFGIGILSCFMGDKSTNQVEISTKHFSHDSDALRMSMHGTSGYYYLANRRVCPRPVAMKGVSPEEKRSYRTDAGTAIAVRTNLYQSGKYRSFREILDRYVVYPMVPVHYEDEKDSFDYPTEQDLMATIHSVHPSVDLNQQGVLEFSPTDEQIRDLEEKNFGLKFEEKPKVVLKCIALDQCTESPNLSGVALLTTVMDGKSAYKMKLGMEYVQAEVNFAAEKTNHQLVLSFRIQFPKEFIQRMELCEAQQEAMEDKIRRLIIEAESPLTQEILGAIYRGHDNDKDWRKWIQSRFGISTTTLSEKLKNIRASVIKNDLYEKDRLVYRDYKRVATNKQIIPLCDLNTLPWYRQFFGKSSESCHISLVAHNGVYCGDAHFFVSSSQYNSAPKEILLLLKDRYRPEVDVARTGVQQLPLDAAVELNIFRREWVQQGYNVNENDSSLAEAEYWMIPQKTYCKLIEERPDLVKRLCFDTQNGRFGVEELSRKLQEFGRLELKNCPQLISSSVYTKNQYLYEYFCLAYLRKEYMLIGSLESYGHKIFILPKPTIKTQTSAEHFPPSFFLPVEGDKTQITSKYSYSRRFCNENHPLSNFLIDNQDILKLVVPGLYQELMRSLASDNMNEMISKVNDMLTRIQSLPQGKIRVPESAFLTVSDFTD